MEVDMTQVRNFVHASNRISYKKVQIRHCECHLFFNESIVPAPKELSWAVIGLLNNKISGNKFAFSSKSLFYTKCGTHIYLNCLEAQSSGPQFYKMSS